ncbi:MAG: hypothetical protein ACYS80_16330 [Planctomycetota bacterium]|jgi:hypothetical protein
MDNNENSHYLQVLETKSGKECAQLLYEVAMRGEEIEKQIKSFLYSEYLLFSSYHRKQWWNIDSRESVKGTAIRNPDTDSGGFPDLATLLKWCIENREIGKAI